jgi:hypothetical protein
MPFTDDEVLLLLDLELDVALPTRFNRLRTAVWWVALTVGAVLAMYVVLQADYGLVPPRVAG